MLITLTLAAASLWAAVATAERFGNAPLAAAQGTGAPFGASGTHAGTHARMAARHAVPALAHVAARKADDRVRPRGRRL